MATATRAIQRLRNFLSGVSSWVYILHMMYCSPTDRTFDFFQQNLRTAERYAETISPRYLFIVMQLCQGGIRVCHAEDLRRGV